MPLERELLALADRNGGLPRVLDVVSVRVREDRSTRVRLLFYAERSLEELIIAEQFPI